MTKTVTQILDEIKALPRIEANYERGKELIQELGIIPIMIFPLNPYEYEITRAIIPWDNLIQVKDLSYKDQRLNATYQRASTPYKTMFYGCFVPPEVSYSMTRILSAFESSKFLRNGKYTVGVQKIIYGKWLVKDTIRLVSLVYKPSFYKQGNRLFDDQYIKFLTDFRNVDNISDSLKNEYKKVLFFFAQEFGKQDINDHYDYFWSALFTEVICESGFDGVLYPSVRVKGQFGMNVAIKPEVVDEKMELALAIECTLYKKREPTNIWVDKHITVNTENLTLTYQDHPQYTLQERLAKIGCKSIEELQGVNEISE